MNEINIQGLDKASVLAALYNGSRPQGFGFLQFNPAPMTQEEAQEVIEKTPRMYFDYLKGRVMKVNLSGDMLQTWLYDRDNGDNAAFLALRHAGLISEPEE